MKIRFLSALVGDRIPRSSATTAHVLPMCETPRAVAYVCVSCCSNLANLYNLAEHAAGEPGQSHVIAVRCRSCFGFHELTAPTLERVHAAVQLWPFTAHTLPGAPGSSERPPSRNA